jgi:hypothetical protein
MVVVAQFVKNNMKEKRNAASWGTEEGSNLLLRKIYVGATRIIFALEIIPAKHIQEELNIHTFIIIRDQHLYITAM